jgi:transglutaminase 1
MWYILILCVCVQITPAVDAIVGQWKMDIDTKLKNDGAVSYSHKDPIFILFNPWCRRKYFE